MSNAAIALAAVVLALTTPATPETRTIEDEINCPANTVTVYVQERATPEDAWETVEVRERPTTEAECAEPDPEPADPAPAESERPRMTDWLPATGGDSPLVAAFAVGLIVGGVVLVRRAR